MKRLTSELVRTISLGHFSSRWIRRRRTTLPAPAARPRRRVPGALAFLRSFAPPPQPRTLFGLQFRNPIGLAAGFDKNGVAIPAWEALGFGFVEIGTVTATTAAGKSATAHFSLPKTRGA